MKHVSSLSLLLLLAGTVAAQTLTNAGAQLTVGAGATLYVSGSLDNQAASTLTNAGTVQVTGDLTNTGALTSPGTLVFAGAANQTFTPGTATVGYLTVSNTGAAGSNILSVPTNLTVGGQLLLTQGMVRTSATSAITLADGATLSGEAVGRYVQGNLSVVDNNGSGLQDFGNGLILDRTSLGMVVVTRTAGLQTAGLSYGVNAANTSLQGIDRIWNVVTATQPAGPLAVTLQWLPDDDNGLADFSNAQGWYSASGPTAWAPAGSSAPATQDATTLVRSLTFTAPATGQSLGYLTISNAANPLPVSLLSFTAERRGPAAVLRWATASELRNNRFEVEAGTDGLSFRAIGTVRGAGTSSQRHEYAFTDANLSRYGAPVVYYRLRQVDEDGSAHLSEVRPVTYSVPAAYSVQAYPNPFGSSLVVRVAGMVGGPATFVLHDAVGREVVRRQRTLPPGAHDVTLAELDNLPKGLYVLTVQTPSGRRTLKLERE
ncbi:T9SS type A sorting domain-containing protein [Hymenobacter sp. BT18]|uniref:T9SS type A sorting domain-containing protein n=1 Tax=Hymenobacter sp. BT18 TaxID=2835648 RepID=UPI00143E4ED8|nr:T9SS type A sorting domain-containing protein [Hymenobacter sp. BT18]QIX61585.1 T9SS type A sorting domain-containing protein [Hymenobacter sp. BT18]